MQTKPESPKLLHIIIPAATTLLVALIGLGTAIYQTEKPIQLTEVAQTAQANTQTAAAPTLNAQATQSAFAPTYLAQTIQAAFTSTLAAETVNAPTSTPARSQPTSTQAPSVTASEASPSFNIDNKLYLPVKIFIDNVYQNDLDSGGYRTYTLNRTPASVTWSVVKQTTVKGSPLGHDMSGTFDNVTGGDELTIDNLIDNQPYFYPIINNTTKKDCDVTINKGWNSEYVTGAVASASSDNVGFGYYKLFTNSNVTLNCAGKSYWWGIQPDDTSGTSFFDEVEKDTGVIYFTLK